MEASTSGLVPGSGGDGRNGWEDEFHRKVAEIEIAAREWGVRWHQPEGRFISTMMGALSMLAGLSRSGQRALSEAALSGQKAVEAELAQVREMRRAVEASLQQTRNAELALVVHKEELALRMIDQTLPLFADRLHDALVIREKSWNAEARFRRYALVAGAVLGLFVFGYLVAAWQGDDRIVAFDQCLVQPIQAEGHLYCNIDSWFPPRPELKK